jgi:hypothetical protein
MNQDPIETGFSEEQVNFELAAITRYKEELNQSGGSMDKLLAAYARISNVLSETGANVQDEQAYYDFRVDVAYLHLLEYLIAERALKEHGYRVQQNGEKNIWVK